MTTRPTRPPLTSWERALLRDITAQVQQLTGAQQRSLLLYLCAMNGQPLPADLLENLIADADGRDSCAEYVRVYGDGPGVGHPDFDDDRAPGERLEPDARHDAE